MFKKYFQIVDLRNIRLQNKFLCILTETTSDLKSLTHNENNNVDCVLIMIT